MRKIFLFLILLIGLIFLFFLFKNILYPSYLSVSSACGIISDEELNDSGYFVAGEYDQCTDTITIYYNTTSVNKHENCHRFQKYKGNLKSCDNKIGLFFNEIECYSVENLPDKIYDRIYL